MYYVFFCLAILLLAKCLENSSAAHVSSGAGERRDRLGVVVRSSPSTPEHSTAQGHEQKL